MNKEKLKKIIYGVLKNFSEIEKGNLPNTKIIRALKQFAKNDFENFQISDDIPPEMRKDLLWYHNELRRDGGKNLTLNQLARASHLYNKKANYLRFKYACLLSYKSWAKQFHNAHLNLMVINAEFPKEIKTAKAKEAYLMSLMEESEEESEDIKLLISLQNTINFCESQILMYEDDSKRTDRELTTLNRLSESKLIEQKNYLNNNRQ